MKALKKLLDTTIKRVIAILVVVVIVTWLILFFAAGQAGRDAALELITPLLWTFLVVAVVWLSIHFGLKAWRKRKRSEFDQAVAAKEGIEDRRREWSTWTQELEKQGIDRYELPFYLLVGEPQSGKSVLLHNSDLHFPFGQNRLSGVGGTRGCDWWFTEEAVVLDLAGRLFTHEGGATDRLEFEAFLQLLYEFRPLCPANGVILVIPCDSLLKDSAELCGAKATKIQNALLSLTTKLQAQLPVYLVLTKGDQVFGFAESVHRLDVERRHQMFGWSRPAEKIDAPFDVAEAVQGFEELVRRSRLLRAHMSAGARLPEALPEIDRMYAFPHELAGMQPNLEVYLKRIFTASNITDRVFFRGLYLTSGLQSGVPIAKVCTELFGKAGEADMRDLQALFSKPRAYFIKDLVRNRVFGERGLVRPTQGRVQQTRRTSLVGYGLSGLLVCASVIWAAVYLMTGEEEESSRVYESALMAANRTLGMESPPVESVLVALQQIRDAAERKPEAYEKMGGNPRREGFQELYCELFDAQMVPAVRSTALDVIEKKVSEHAFASHDDLVQTCEGLAAFMDGIDLGTRSHQEAVLGCLPSYKSSLASGEPWDLETSFRFRNKEYAGQGDDDGLSQPLTDDELAQVLEMADGAVAAIEGCLEPGATTAPSGPFGFMVAWHGAQVAREALLSDRLEESHQAIELSIAFSGAMRTLKEIEKTLGKTRKVAAAIIAPEIGVLAEHRGVMVEFIKAHDKSSALEDGWSGLDTWANWAMATFNERGEAQAGLADMNIAFGSNDLTQFIYKQTADAFEKSTHVITVGPDGADPHKDWDDGLLALCDHALPPSLTNPSLIGLGERIRDLDKKTLEREDELSRVFKVFLAQCSQAAHLFEKDLPTAEALVRATTGAEPSAIDAMRAPLAELTDIHRALTDLIVVRKLEGSSALALRDWQREIERLLSEHIADHKKVEGWIDDVAADGRFSTQAWAVLMGLGEAARLTLVAPQDYRVSAEAKKLQRAVFFHLAAELDSLWSARPVEQIGETRKTVDELQLLADEVASKLGPGASSLGEGTELAGWSGKVDALLGERIDHVRSLAERLWKPDLTQRSLNPALAAWKDQLTNIQGLITRSEEEGMREIDFILAALEKDGSIDKLLSDLRLTESAIGGLRFFEVPKFEADVTNDQEHKALMRVIEAVWERDERSQEPGPYLAGQYLDELSASHRLPERADMNAGIRLVRDIRTELGTRVRQEIQSAYLDELKELLASNKYRDLGELIFWDPTQEVPASDSNKAVAEDLGALLDARGAFYTLGEKYKLFGKKPEDPSIGLEIFPAQPDPDEDERAALHRFLAGLQKFLLGDKGKRIREARIAFHIEPRFESGTVWSTDTRTLFWFPKDDSVSGVRSKLAKQDMGTLAVRGWSFDTSSADLGLLFIWSNQTTENKALLDSNAYVYELPTCLAPLLLAWSGRAEDDTGPSALEFLVQPAPRGTTLSAPMRLVFEQDLPLRPSVDPLQ